MAQKQTTSSRIRAALPATLATLRAAMPDVHPETVGSCVRSLMGQGHIAKGERGLLVAAVPAKKVAYVRKQRTVPDNSPKNSEAARSVAYAEMPSQSPRVTCPARSMVALSTCLDDYTATASGHRLGPAECGKCSVGQLRREQLARSME